MEEFRWFFDISVWLTVGYFAAAGVYNLIVTITDWWRKKR